MGSAAPSRRRRFVGRPLLGVVAAVVALAAGLGAFVGSALLLRGDGDEERAEGSAVPIGGAGELAAGPVTTVGVELGPGWVVPPTAAEPATDRLPPGTATVGALVAVDGGATTVIIDGAGPDLRLAYRTRGRPDEAGDDTDELGWQDLAVPDDEGPDARPGEEGAAPPTPRRAAAIGPIWLGQDAEAVELVVVGGEPTPLRLIFLAGGDPGTTGDVRPDPAGPSSAVAVDGGPPVVPRERWATSPWAEGNDGCGRRPGVADRLQAVVVHHTVTTNRYGPDDVDDLLRAIHYGHVVVNGWCDIGYNFVVDRFGTIWEARTGSIDSPVIGGHAKGFNTATVGVALLGQHEAGAQPAAEPPSEAAGRAVAELAAWKLGRHHVDPEGRTWLRNRSSRPPHRLAPETWHNVPTVLAHRDLGVTGCPGNHGVALARDLPPRLAPVLRAEPPYQLAGWRRHDHGPGFVVADRRGGLRPAGTTAPPTPHPAVVGPGNQILAVGGNPVAGYLLTSAGTLVPYGSAPAVDGAPAGSAVGVDLQVRADGRAGWVLDRTGRLHGFGGAPDLTPAGLGSTGSIEAVAVALDAAGRGQVVDAAGRLHPVGGAPAVSIDQGARAGAAVVDLDVIGDGDGATGWVLDDAGRVHGFGRAPATAVPAAAERGGVRAVAAADIDPGGWVLDAEGQLWPFGGARLIFPVATDAAGRSAVDLDYHGDVYHDEFVDSDDAAFLRAVQRLLAGREPSVAELDAAATVVEQGSGRLELTSQLVTSDHWSGATIDALYRDVLGRPAEPEGRAYWLGEVAAGLKLADLGTYFYGSEEYARSASSPQVYVTNLYRSILHRAPEPDGLRYWVGQLTSGRARPVDVAAGFYASIESRRDRVTRLHRLILGRGPSADERQSWAERLPEIDDTGLAARLAASSEYYRLAVDGT